MFLVTAFRSVEGLHWSVQPRFEPGAGTALQLPDASPTEIRRTLSCAAHPMSYATPLALPYSN